MTTVTVTSWAQTALGQGLPADDAAGPLPAPAFTPGLSLTGPDGTPIPVTGPADLRMLGPDAVAALDSRAVLRRDPPPGAGDVEDNYLVCAELQPAELPWLFTPARPDARARLRPWIVLVVVETAASTLAPGTPTPVLTTRTDQLPDLDDSWGWAHVQRGSGTGGDLARLMCPRQLTPGTRYRACIVPSFTRDPGTGAYTPAWQTGQDSDVGVPVYDAWEFGTGQSGDFESLVRRLGPAPQDSVATLGGQLVDIHAPWPDDAPLAGAAGPAPLPVPGALVPFGAAATPAVPPGMTADFVARLAAQCDAAAGPAPAGPDGDSDPTAVAPPVYGGRHVNRDTIPATEAQSSDWLDELNQHIPTRIAAGIGAAYVRANQEMLMAKAWEQAGAIREANRRRGMAQLASAVGESLHRRHVQPLGTDELVSLAAPAAGRIRPWGAGPPLPTAIAVSVLPDGASTSAFARFVRPGGPVARSAGLAQRSLIARALSGDISLPQVTSGTPPAPAAATATAPPAATAPAHGTGAAQVAQAGQAATAAADLIRLQAYASTAQNAGLIAAAGALTSALAGVPADLAAVTSGRVSTVQSSIVPHLATVLPAIASAHAILPNPPSGQTGLAATPAGIRLNAQDVTQLLTSALHPATGIAQQVAAQVSVPATFTAESDDELSTVMRCPEFPAPMVLGLLDFAPNWFLPGIAEFPAESIALLTGNNAFIEAFLTGLAHEFNRELLWREYPTDLRGTPFRQFWPRPDGQLDIPAINRWTGHLGTHLTQDAGNLAVILVRGTVVRRFPDFILAAAPALSATPGQLPVPQQDPAAWKPPMFVVPVDGQTQAYAFDIPRNDLQATPTPQQPGWFFAFQEHSSRVRFGYDLDSSGFSTWNDLDWNRVLTGSPGGRPFARAGADIGTPDSPGDVRWNRDAADIARASLQRPFRMLIHSSELVGPALWRTCGSTPAP
jgi:hypothetical protein